MKASKILLIVLLAAVVFYWLGSPQPSVMADAPVFVSISPRGIEVATGDPQAPEVVPATDDFVSTSPPVTPAVPPADRPASVAESHGQTVVTVFNGEVAAYNAPTQQEAQVIAETIASNPYQVTSPSGYSAEYREEMSQLKSSGAVLIDIPPIRPDYAAQLYQLYGPNLEHYPTEDGRIQLLDAIERGKNPALSILSLFRPVTWLFL